VILQGSARLSEEPRVVQKRLVLVITVEAAGPEMALIRVSGRVMLGPDSQRIESEVASLLKSGTKKIIFDLSGVTHIDSTGIGRFIAALNAVMRAGGKLAIAGAAGQVREGFRLTRLDTVFAFYDTAEAAQAAL
jgi:anti-sigma B factor antagonist